MTSLDQIFQVSVYHINGESDWVSYTHFADEIKASFGFRLVEKSGNFAEGGAKMTFFLIFFWEVKFDQLFPNEYK